MHQTDGNQAAMPDAEYQKLEADIAKLFLETLNINVSSVKTDLLDSGVLDSQKFVELLLHLEQDLGATIGVDDFEIENFRSIEEIARLVFNRTNSALAS